VSAEETVLPCWDHYLLPGLPYEDDEDESEKQEVKSNQGNENNLTLTQLDAGELLSHPQITLNHLKNQCKKATPSFFPNLINHRFTRSF